MNYNSSKLVPVAIPIMPQAMQSEGWRVGKDGDPCPTLDRSAVPAVAVGCFKSGQSAKARSLGFSETESPTLGASGGNGIPAVAIVAPISFDCKGLRVNVDRNGVAQTLRAMNAAESHASGGGHIAIASQTMQVAPTITATNDPSRSPQSSEITQQVAAVHASTMQVRRLTPTECERLQGFPDGWTAIPWKKKPADQCPDGPRYKALGNSMAVNCMEWLGERIQAVESGTL